MSPDHQLLDDDIRCPDCGSLDVCDCEGHPMNPTVTPEAARLAEEAIRRMYSVRDEVWKSARGSNDVDVGSALQACREAIERLAEAKQDAAPTSAAPMRVVRFDSSPARTAATLTMPAGFWLAPMEPDEAMYAAGLNQRASKLNGLPMIYTAMRDSYLARNPGACSVTDGEAKK